MRRFVLPAIVLVVVIAASMLASRANDAADPGDPPQAETVASLGTPLFNVRRAPEWLRRPTTVNQLERAVLAAMDTLGEDDSACLSVHRDGESIAEVVSTEGVTPGELQRLVTLGAFDTLGSTAYTTEVVRSSADLVTDGTLDGDIWLIGGADPVLSTAAYVDRFDDDRARTSIEEFGLAVADELRAQGITRIVGSVLGDESKYAANTRVYGPETWPSADVESNVVGPMSALLLNNGFDDFPDVVDPPSNGRSPNPAIDAAEALTGWIRFAGIEVTGAPGAGIRPDALSQIPVASVDSPPLDAIAERALLDGTTAEMLFRELSLRNGGDSSQFGGILTVPARLIEAGVIAEDEGGSLLAADGSGLSSNNRARCEIVTTILDAGEGSLAVDALPPIAETTLAECAPSGPASLDAYRSTRPDSTAMAGRAVASNGDVITFSVMVNWAPDAETEIVLPRDACDSLIAALLDAIGDHPAGPSLDQLTPLPAVEAAATE